jgi:long-chain fatty acid transport protein
MKKVLGVLAIGLLAGCAGALASGLGIPEQGAAAMGMSAAMTARNEDLSAIFYNPAGLDYVQGFEIMIGDTPIRPSHQYRPFIKDRDLFSETDANKNTYLPPHIYAAWSMNKSFVLGLGVNAPFGLGSDWDESWDGRYNSTFAEITMININPTVTWRATNVVSIGAGMSYYSSSATIEKMIDTGASVSPTLMANTNYDSKFKLEGDGSGYGFNFGVLVKPVESKYQFGASFRSGFDIEYDGTAQFIHQATNLRNAFTASFMAKGVNAVTAAAMADSVYRTNILGAMPSSQDGTATLNMPWMLNFGIKSQMSEVWDVSADFDVVGWKRYKELVIDFADNRPVDKLIQDKSWENSWVLRGGTTYNLNSSWVLRGGALFDFNPVPSETFDSQLPDSDRYGLSLGAGYKFGNVRLDASYLLLKFLIREKDNAVGWSKDTTGDGTVDRFDLPTNYPVANGKYKSTASLFSLTASYSF